MTLAEAVTPPTRLASWNFRFPVVSAVVDSVHVDFVPCHGAGTLPSLHVLSRCVLFAQLWVGLESSWGWFRVGLGWTFVCLSEFGLSSDLVDSGIGLGSVRGLGLRSLLVT